MQQILFLMGNVMKALATERMAESLSVAYMDGYRQLVRETINSAWSQNISTDWRRATYELLPDEAREEFLKMMLGQL